jgi:hypothetical protein
VSCGNPWHPYCAEHPSTPGDKPVDEGVTLQPALDEFVHPRAVERDPHYFGTVDKTLYVEPPELEQEHQARARLRAPLEEIAGVVSEIHQRLVAIEQRLNTLEYER